MRLMKINHRPENFSIINTLCLTLSLIFTVQFFYTNITLASTDAERKSILRGTVYYDESDSACSFVSTPSTSTPYQKGSKIYVIGDSLTVGMRDLGGLQDKLQSSGWTVTNSPSINAITGKSISWGTEQLGLASEKSLLQNSDTVLIGLGTNNISSFPDSMQLLEEEMNSLISSVQTTNPTATIFWTNFYGKGTYGGNNLDDAINGTDNAVGLNGTLEKVASANNIRIINWSSKGSTYVAENEVHPNGKYNEMSDFIVSSLNSGGGVMAPEASLAGCDCSAGLITGNYTKEERYAYTWGFFVTTKGLSPEATAGIMGNLEAESGIDPHNMQNTAPLPDGPVFPTVVDSSGKTVPDPQIAGKFGYGIAQWTSAGRQQNLINFATESSRSTGDLSLQLDFIWKEFTESYTSVLAKLQEPNVTVAASSEEVLGRFEIPQSWIDGGASRQNVIAARLAKSQAIYEQYSGSNGSIAPSQSCNNNTSTVIDPNAPDTSNIPCAAGTTDRGVVDAYNNGKLFKIRICNYEGAVINSQLSANYVSLITTARKDGINLTGGGFRSIKDQESIYRAWCDRRGVSPTPGPYPKPSYKDYNKCEGGAPPGYSNHEMGFAIDFNCSGVLIPKSYEEASKNNCFTWLLTNASKYGLYEYAKGKSRTKDGYEGWHWSVDGT